MLYKRFWSWALCASAACILLAACGGGAQKIPPAATATGSSQTGAVTKASGVHSGYNLIDLGTFGGLFSAANGITRTGVVSGWSNFAGDTITHATIWQNGTAVDLGTLGGPNSAVGWPNHNNAIFVGDAEVAALDPNNEKFCDPVPNQCLGFKWQNGSMHALSTLAGPNAQAAAINNRGEITGWGESKIDASCTAPQVYDLQAVVWSPAGQIRALPFLPGDDYSASIAINNRGQATGGEGNVCASLGTQLAQHAVLWEADGTPVNLGSFGGAMNNYGTAVSDNGTVAGQSDLPGDAVAHAFVWKHGTMTDLGTLDASSSALGMNESGQIVGQSCDLSGNCRGVLWDRGAIIDLNSLLPAGTSLYVFTANDINDRGEISGQGLNLNTGAMPAILLEPNHGHSLSINASVHVMSLPQRVRETLLHRRSRFGHGM